MTIEDNRLWACAPTENNLKALKQYPHFKATSEYCLVISPHGEDWMVEIEGVNVSLLTEQDWQWLVAESEKIRREDEERYRAELLASQDEFLKRFAEELSRVRETTERETDDGGDVGTEE